MSHDDAAGGSPGSTPSKLGVRRATVCIATFRRPELLDRLLGALADQQPVGGPTPGPLALDVVVVDNDSAMSARPVVEAWGARGLDVRYDVEPCQNISLARNRAVACADGELILFIDDDEVPEPRWAAELVAALDSTGADVVFGPVLSDFAAAAPAWITASPYFNLDHPATGEALRTGGCGNCIVRRELLDTVPGPFDPALGRTGGEDTFLFELLHRRGARLVMCREAMVWEHVPAERLRLAWLARRALRTGSLYARRMVALSDHPTAERLRLALRASAVLAVSTLRALVAPEPVSRGRWALRCVSCVGQLLGVLDMRITGY